MRNFFSILLNITAGLFFYSVCIQSFINDPLMNTAKWWIALGFSIAAFIALGGGLALNRFRNWRRVVGIVFLSSSGFTAFLVFTLACMLATEELRPMIKPDSFKLFSDYISGGIVIVSLAILGLLMLKANKPPVEQHTPENLKGPE